MDFSKITALTEDEIKLFKDDPETFREYLKFKTRQMEIANDVDTKNHEERMKAIDIEHEERMRAYDAEHEKRMKDIDINLEENDRKRKAEAEADKRKYEAEAEARKAEAEADKRKYEAEAEADKRKYEAEAESRKAEMQKIIEANDRREKIWAMAICGVGALCEFMEQKDSKKQTETKTLNNQIETNTLIKQITNENFDDFSSHQVSKEKSYYDPQKESAIANLKF